MKTSLVNSLAFLLLATSTYSPLKAMNEEFTTAQITVQTAGSTPAEEETAGESVTVPVQTGAGIAPQTEGVYDPELLAVHARIDEEHRARYAQIDEELRARMERTNAELAQVRGAGVEIPEQKGGSTTVLAPTTAPAVQQDPPAKKSSSS